MNILSKQFSSPPIIYPTSDDLVLWISGRNRTGNSKILDLSKKGNHGTIIGASWANTPLGHSALSFDGVDDYVDAGNDASLHPSSITLEAWVNAHSLSGWAGIVSNKRSANHGINLQMGTEQNIAALVSDGTNWTYVRTTWTPSIGVWYHIVATHDGGTTVKLYVNGELEATGERGLAYSIADKCAISSFYTAVLPDFPFSGLIDEVRIYNRALSVSEISQRYNKTKYLYGM